MAAITALVSLAVAIVNGAASGEERARIRTVTQPTSDFSKPERYERYPGGAATSFESVNADTFSHPSANMSFERELDFKVGNGIFKKVWVSAPSSTTSSDGLGPLYNARACQRCHLKDGRGHPPSANYPDDLAVSMFLRLSIPPQNEAQRRDLASHRKAVIPEPTYGGQLQNFSVQGHLAEGQMQIEYEEVPVALADGSAVSLRKPTYSIASLNYGPLHPAVMLSPRLAPPMIGLGLLEAIPEEDITARADPEDSDSDGISGKANRVWSAEEQKVMLGRFGWKAGQPTIAQQAAGAFSGDIGISTPLAPAPSGDCPTLKPTVWQRPTVGTKSVALSKPAGSSWIHSFSTAVISPCRPAGTSVIPMCSPGSACSTSPAASPAIDPNT